MGRITWVAAAVLAAACGEVSEPAPTQKEEISASPAEADETGVLAAETSVLNLADDFVTFWDGTVDLSTEERVAIFKRDVASQFPAFYSIERHGDLFTQEEYDARIAKQIESFGDYRGRYIEKVEQFDADLERNNASFREAFPDFQFVTPISLLHSLGEFNGATRELDGVEHLLFGADLLARIHYWSDDSAFFHHELFHTYQGQYFSDCDEIWCALWTEGLAVYVSAQLNPEAGDPELLLEIPDDMGETTRVRLGEALAHLETVLTSTDEDVYSALFNFKQDETGLPRRRGYLLGYVVAEEVGRGRSLEELAKLSNEEARPLIFDAVGALRAREVATP